MRSSNVSATVRAALLAAAACAASVASVACVSPNVVPTASRTVWASYGAALVEVARPAGTAERWGAASAIRVGDSLRYVYADSLVEIRTAVLHDRVAIAVTNRGAEPIEVAWSDAVFVDHEGRLDRMTPTEPAAAPGAVPPGATRADALLPVSRVVHRAASEGAYGWHRGGWEQAPLFPASSVTVWGEPGSTAVARQRAAFQAKVEAMLGRRVAIVLPVASRGAVNVYTLWFAVQSAALVEGPLRRAPGVWHAVAPDDGDGAALASGGGR